MVEIATDKVDSDVPSEVKGVLTEKKFTENDVVQVGEVIAIIQTDVDDPDLQSSLKLSRLKRKRKEAIIPEIPHFPCLTHCPNLRVCPKW